MIAELLVCALFTAVLTISFMLSPPDFSKPLINNVRPPSHMAQIDCLRVLFCLGVLFTHVQQNITGNGLVRWFAVPIGWWGWCAVDVFFMVSGFLTTLKLVKMLSQGRPVEHWRLVIERFLRLWPLLILPGAYGLLRHKGDLYTREGTLSPMKWLGWLTFTGDLYPPMPGRDWVLDDVFVPCWSLLCDFQATVLLILFVPLHYRWCGLRIWPILMPLAIAVAIRAAFHFSNPACFNRRAIGGLPLAELPNTREYIQNNYGVGPVDEMLGGGCFMMQRHAFSIYMQRMYYSVYSRFASFFIGMAVALKYFSVKQGVVPPGEEFGAHGSRTVGRFLLLLSFGWIGAFVLAPYQPTRSPLYLAFEEIFWHMGCSAAFAVLAFCAIVPGEHPFYASWLAKFMGAKCFYVLGNASTWIYVMHWPVFFEVKRWIPDQTYASSLFANVGVLICITVPVAILCMRFIDPPFEALRKFVMNEKAHSMPALKEAGGERQKLLAGTEADDAQRFFANLGPEEAQKALSHLRSKLPAAGGPVPAV